MAGRKRNRSADLPQEVQRALAQGVRFAGGERKRGAHLELTQERTPVSVTLQLHVSEAHTAQVDMPVRALHRVYRGGTQYGEWLRKLSQPLLTGMEPRGRLGEIQELCMQAAMDVLGARRITWLYAAMGVVRRHRMLELHDDELPDSVRLDVMEMTGCPARTANSRQAQEYRDVLHLLRWGLRMVTPHKRRGRPKRGELRDTTMVPLLVVTSYEDGRPSTIQVNPILTHHWMRIPAPLLRLGDGDDPQGLARALGISIITRQQLCMSAVARSGNLLQPERLDKVLERAGLLQWVRECEADTQHRGRLYVKRELEQVLHILHELPHRRGTWLDVVGGCSITWGHGKRWLTGGRLTYGTMPEWLQHQHAQAQAIVQEGAALKGQRHATPALPAAVRALPAAVPDAVTV